MLRDRVGGRPRESGKARVGNRLSVQPFALAEFLGHAHARAPGFGVRRNGSVGEHYRVPRFGVETAVRGGVGEVGGRHHAIRSLAGDGRSRGDFPQRLFSERRRVVETRAYHVLGHTVRVAAELRFEPAEAGMFRNLALRPQFLPQAVQVRLPRGRRIEPGQHVRDEPVDARLEAGRRNRLAFGADIAERVRTRFAGRPGIQGSMPAVGEDGYHRPGVALADARHPVCELPVARRRAGGTPALPAYAPPVPDQPLGQRIPGDTRAAAQFAAIDLLSAGEQSTVCRHRKQTERGFLLRRFEPAGAESLDGKGDRQFVSHLARHSFMTHCRMTLSSLPSS